MPFFQPFGFVVDMRLQADRGFAFVKMESHEKAASAIVRLAGTMINGRAAKVNEVALDGCTWLFSLECKHVN